MVVGSCGSGGDRNCKGTPNYVRKITNEPTKLHRNMSMVIIRYTAAPLTTIQLQSNGTTAHVSGNTDGRKLKILFISSLYFKKFLYRYGTNLFCGSNQVVVGRCGSGGNPDCRTNTGDQAYHGIECCNIEIP